MDIKQTIKRQSLEDIEAQAQRIAGMMDHIRTAMLAPTATKLAPALGSAQLADLCGVDKSKIAYRLTRGDLPAGSIQGNRREWSMGEAQLWSRDFRSEHMRPKGAAGITITVANFKGGVAKTTSAVTLAQGLSMRGHKVLLLDLDPQGSATTLFGVLPDAEVDTEHTAMPLFAGDEDDLAYAIRTTYWPSIDLVCAAPLLYGAEFVLPARQAKDPGFEFWRVLDRGLDTLREAYDVIVIDTPPSLSYVTINALMAADGVIMPLPPSALDFASSAQFWDLFSDLCNQLIRSRGKNKSFEFIDVLLSRVEASDAASSVVRQWVLEGYGDKVLPIEIPKTAVAATASAEFGTVYDLPRGSVSSKTFARARDAYDRMCELVEQQIRAVWARQLSENAMLVAGD
ncbi:MULTISPECIES: ParA family protein [Variovorax]|uniref:ParA family protein n=1 Tax=Variovorax TaxID=34072 RepID=UPI001385319B|nr:AAA family ATPase [Variovorax sp.]KAF1069363.1 MAG: Sporulation initiation inhibitor protein Soj [Variovorax sp.]